MSQIIQNIRTELKDNIEELARKSVPRFFKEEVKYYGVKGAIIKKIAKRYWKAIKGFEKKEIFKLCEELYSSDYIEEAGIVSFWIPNLVSQLEPDDLALFKEWIEKYINNWAKCDGLCNHTIGGFIEKYPERLKDLKEWAKSNNRWMKRAAAVSLIIPAKKGRFLTEILEIADLLLTDKDDMVQKGYGWMLKEASRQHQKDVFDYVIKNRMIMPRIALRYAIELMPKELKTVAMERKGRS
ncbi:MAG: DNA alkylation repair protein [bacterium]